MLHESNPSKNEREEIVEERSLHIEKFCTNLKKVKRK